MYAGRPKPRSLNPTNKNVKVYNRQGGNYGHLTRQGNTYENDLMNYDYTDQRAIAKKLK